MGNHRLKNSKLLAIGSIMALGLCACSTTPTASTVHKTKKPVPTKQAAASPHVHGEYKIPFLEKFEKIGHFCKEKIYRKTLALVSPESITDGPPNSPICVEHIPDAEPKQEPLSRYGNPASYEVFGKKYHVMKSTKHGHTQTGLASWYGTKFHGRRTSSGEPYDLYSMTAAHKRLPLPTYVKVKNLKNNREVIVKVNDRGPFVSDRIIDLSYAAAQKLGICQMGTAPVSITVIDPKHPEYTKNKKTKDNQEKQAEQLAQAVSNESS